MKLGEIKEQIAMTIGVYSERGNKLAPELADVADYYKKMNAYIDMAQKHIAESKYIKRRHRFTHILPFTPKEQDFAIRTHQEKDIIINGGKAFAYSFKVDNYADVILENVKSNGEIEILDQIPCYADNQFEVFKDIIDHPEIENVRLRFTGDFTYNLTDVAFYKSKYLSRDSIPTFGRYIEYQMPEDFKRVLGLFIRRNDNMKKLENASWLTPDTLSVSAYEQGEIIIDYAANPKTITSATPDDYELELMQVCQSAIVYYASALLVNKEDYSQHQLLMNRYIEAMANISNDTGRVLQTRVKRA